MVDLEDLAVELEVVVAEEILHKLLVQIIQVMEVQVEIIVLLLATEELEEEEQVA